MACIAKFAIAKQMGTWIGPVQNSVMHIRHQSQPKLRDLADNHISNINRDIQVHNHRKLQRIENQEREEDSEKRTCN